MGKKLFVTDLDGTLLRDDKTIAQEDLATLDRLRQKKVIVAVATGRSLFSFHKALKGLGMGMPGKGPANPSLPVDYVIFSTGAGILEFLGNNLIYSRAINSSDVRQIMDCFDRQKFDYMVHRAIPGTRFFLYKSHGGDNPDFQSRLALYKEYASPLEGQAHPPGPATEVLAVIPNGIRAEVLEGLRTDLAGFSVIRATSPLDHRSAWVEVFHRDVSKSAATAWLAGQLGIGRENVVSVGNDYNDQDLLAWSGKGFVVENAPPGLKNVFTTVTSNNHRGVTRAARASGLI
jgi:hypothetical protein